jgi:hypothetical protein
MPVATLRAWLRKTPQPTSIRVLDVDDNPHEIKLTEDARNRWRVAEEAIYASKARSVQCIDKDGKILRAQTLEVDGDGHSLDPEEAIEKRTSKIVANERRELASLIDRYGDRLNEAFERGAAAASVSQENLVSLVDALAQRYADAMTGFHTANAKYAQSLVDAASVNGDPNDRMVMELIGGAVARYMSGGPQKPAPPDPKQNGKGNGKA